MLLVCNMCLGLSQYYNFLIDIYINKFATVSTLAE